MNKTDELKKHFADELHTFNEKPNAKYADSINEFRKAAVDILSNTPFPTVKDEEWKYTDVTPLAGYQFSSAKENSTKIKISDLKKLLPRKLDCYQLVFINGCFNNKMSKLPQDGAITVQPLNTALQSLPDLAASSLQAAANGKSFFEILNAAYIEYGAFVNLQNNTVLDKPVYIIYLAASDHSHYQPRNIFNLGKNSEAVIIESYESLADHVYFTNSVTDVTMGENSRLTHVKIQDESTGAFHIYRGGVKQERDSVYTNYNLSFGARIGRSNTNVKFNGENCEAHLYGLYLTGQDQLVDNHTLIDHAKPNCASNELYKGVLNGNSKAVFNGKVFVRPLAQKTNAFQENKNILLSETATVDTKPQLEIFADDVKCSHGATVGQLDEKSLFYLRSRGIGKDRARDILIYAFADDTVRNLKIPSVVQYVEDKISRKLNSHF